MQVERGGLEIQDVCSWLMVWARLPLANKPIQERFQSTYANGEDDSRWELR